VSRDSKSSQSSPLFKILNFVKIFFKTKVVYHTQEREALISIINENCKNFSLLNIDAKLVWLLNNENIDILCALCTFLKPMTEGRSSVLPITNVHA
jgi:hypothetical protein